MVAQWWKMVVFETFFGFRFSKFSIYFFSWRDFKKKVPPKWTIWSKMEQIWTKMGPQKSHWACQRRKNWLFHCTYFLIKPNEDTLRFWNFDLNFSNFFESTFWSAKSAILSWRDIFGIEITRTWFKRLQISNWAREASFCRRNLLWCSFDAFESKLSL